MSTYFTSDTHFGHSSILHLGNGRPFKTVEEMDLAMISRWNERITWEDDVWFLGDFTFYNSTKTSGILSRLQGRKHLIWGNHDKPLKNKLSFFESEQQYKVLTVEGQKLILFHFPILSWLDVGKGSWMLHGHCVDLETEILTNVGWKFRDELKSDEIIATVNPVTGITEYQSISEIIDLDWSGSVYNIASKSFDGRFTPDHTMLTLSNKLSFEETRASDFSNRTNRKVPQAAPSSFPDYSLSDDMLRLYIWAVTDGSRENSTLLRFHLRKERKLFRLRELLGRLGIPFSDNLQSSGTTKINLTLPEELRSFSIKPLDEFVKNLSQRQAEILVEEYCHTDGNWNPRGWAFQISTSKYSEANLLQEVLVTHGYRCNLTVRHDMVYGDRYILSGNRRRFATTSKSPNLVSVDTVVSERFWCVKVPNQTFFIRRNGKVHITGNCHSNLPPETDMARLDVGVDGHDFRPWSFPEIQRVLKNRHGLPGDHHDH